MNKKQVWQYQCEFCGKKKYSAGHMKHHESVCTMNPNRVCGMCRLLGFEQTNPYKLIEICRGFESVFDGMGIVDIDKETKVFSILEDAANECPACILSALRLSETFLFGDQFDYKRERENFWKSYNEENRAREYYGTYY